MPLTPWLITRAADEAQILVDRLRKAGIAAEPFPCIERRVVKWRPDPEAWRGRAAIFMVSSPFGARCLIAHWPQLEGHGRVAALAPTTARILESAGIPVAISASGGAEGLAQAVVEHKSAQDVLIVWLTSAAGLVEPEQERAAAVLRAVADVRRIVAYETRSPDDLGTRLQEWRGKRACAVFFSPSACRGFLAARAAGGHGPVLERVACIGQSTLRSWSELRPRGLPEAVYQGSEADFLEWVAASH